ncbi:zinc ribbon domain-containing protein [candidate division KSB1 bacterium]|nr:zinc ribbon domain-containing protein [candidate division KSB1 bacterium]
MPIFEYKCRQCGEKFEELIFSSQGEGGVGCPHCGSGEVEKCPSLFGFSSGSKTVSSVHSSSCSSCSVPSCNTCRP